MSTNINFEHGQAVYTITKQLDCVLIKGAVPVRDFAGITALAPADAVLDTDAARVLGVTFAIGRPDDLLRLRSEVQNKDVIWQVSDRYRNAGLSGDAIHWLAVGERGASSDAIFSVLTGVNVGYQIRPTAHPLDPGDFRRCRLLLEAVPELLPMLPGMAEVSPEWAGLVGEWESLCALMDGESPQWREAQGSAQATYEAMQAIINVKKEEKCN